MVPFAIVTAYITYTLEILTHLLTYLLT